MNQVSLVEQLKEVLKAQNASLRLKHDELKALREENSRLTGLVGELEIENEGLKGLLSTYQTDSAAGATEKGPIDNGTLRPSTLSVSSPNTTGSELYTTALSSPEPKGKTLDDQVTITLSSTPNSNCLSPKKATFGRGESRKKNRKSCYELSPDISDKHVQILEKKYGGKERANRAARIIQQYYRKWSMNKTYCRLRTQSAARRLSMKGYRSKRSSMQSPNSSGSMSPNGLALPLNLNLSISESENSNELALKSPESPNRQRRNSAKDEFKPIQTDINIDSNFGHVDTSKPDLAVRRVSEDISSIEVSKNLLNDSAGQQKLIDEVFQQILSPRKDSISLANRSDSFRSRKSEKMSIVEESIEVTETTVTHLDKAPKDTMTEGVDGIDGTNGVDAVDGAGQVNGMEEVKVCVESVESMESVEMTMDERPAENDVIVMSNDNLSVKEEQDELGDSLDSFDIDDSHAYSWPALDQLSHRDDTTSLGGNSLSPSSSIMQTFYEDKEKDVRIGINHFNRKPKKGINYLIDTGVLDDFDAEGICRFLREEPGINKQKIGEYLGDLRNELSMAVLHLFVRTIPMEGKEVDEALRLFQTFFRMPGEAQKIERIVEEFSTAYVDANPGKVSDNSDTILVLAFAIIMLNTDLHSPNVKRKMSKEQFTRNLRGTDDGEDLPSDLLSAIYDRVEKRAFKTGPDNLDAIYKYEKQILGKVPWTTLALPHRQLRQVTTLYEIQHGGKKKEKPHHRVVFLFNDMVVITKERGQAGQKGIHYYSYKSSYQLCDIKFQLFNNNYYKYGLRILNRVTGEVHIIFHAKKEDIRKAFYTELRDCIEETNVMENERITDEKSRQLMGNRRDLEDTISLTLPSQFGSFRKKKLAPDSLSLVNEPGSLSQGALIRSPLSSSLQDLNQTDGGFYEDNLHKSSSVAAFEFPGKGPRASVSSEFSFSNGSMQNVARKTFGLFSSKRVKNPSERKLTKSTGSLEEIKSMRRKTSTSNSEQRKSEFFVTSPIAT